MINQNNFFNSSKSTNKQKTTEDIKSPIITKNQQLKLFKKNLDFGFRTGTCLNYSNNSNSEFKISNNNLSNNVIEHIYQASNESYSTSLNGYKNFNSSITLNSNNINISKIDTTNKFNLEDFDINMFFTEDSKNNSSMSYIKGEQQKDNLNNNNERNENNNKDQKKEKEIVTENTEKNKEKSPKLKIIANENEANDKDLKQYKSHQDGHRKILNEVSNFISNNIVASSK